MSVDLSKYQQILFEDFDYYSGHDSGINLRDDRYGDGLWSTSLNSTANTNGGAGTFFSDPTLETPDGTAIDLNPFDVDNGILTINSGHLTDAQVDQIAAALPDDETLQTAIANDQIEYYSGLLSLDDSWSQTNGYFEVRARMPEEVGHLVSAWMINTDAGAVPEIDIFEILGRQNGSPYVDANEGSFGRRDNEVNGAVIFENTEGDTYNDFGVDADGNPIYTPTTPAHLDYTVNAGSRTATEKVFKNTIDSQETAGLDVFDDFIVYAVEWTAESVSFFIGADSDSLVKFYETETPAGFDTDIAFLLWDRIGGNYAGNPDPDDPTSLQASVEVDYIKIFAENPDLTITADSTQTYVLGTDQDERIVGNAQDNVIFAGDGLDNVVGGAGADVFFLTRDLGNLIIEDFDASEGDTLALEGTRFGTPEDAFASLTQVGDDVWLINGREDVGQPQTVIFRDTNLSAFSASDIEIVAAEGDRPVYSDAIDTFTGSNVVGTDDTNDYLIARFIAAGDNTLRTAEQLIGGQGDDTYFLNQDSEVIEGANAGIDQIMLAGNGFGEFFDIPDNVENLTLQSANATTGVVGNDLSNRIIGNQNGTVFAGGAGNDFIDIAGGANTVIFGTGGGIDIIENFGSDDVLQISDSSFLSFDHLWSALSTFDQGVVFDLGNGDALVLRDTTIDQLSQSNFDVVYQTSIENPDTGELLALADFTIVTEANNSGKTIGTTANDAVQGDEQNNILWGKGGHDILQGFDGNDDLDGGAGRDILFGGAGDDTLKGGAGNDTLEGGSGSDLFTFADGDGIDTVTDFETGIDRISIDADSTEIVISDTNDGARIQYGTGEVLITGVSAADVGASLAADEVSDDGAVQPVELMGRITGEDGVAETFVWTSNTSDAVRLRNFEAGSDLIDLTIWGIDEFADLSITDTGSNLKLRANGNRLILEGVDNLSDLSSDDFLF